MMKSLLLYLQNKDYRLQTHMFIALVFTIPLFDRVVALIISLITVQWLLCKNWKKRFTLLKAEKWRWILLFYSFLYIIYLLGLIYSSNFSYATFDLGLKLSLLIFPLIFATTVRDVFNTKRLLSICYAYIAGCILITLVMLIAAFFNFTRTNSTQVFYYNALSIFQHPSYLSMYLDFAVSIILVILLKVGNQISKPFRNLLVFLVLYFLAIIMLLSSKAGIICLLLVLTLSIISIIIYRKDYLIGLLFLFILPFTFLGAFYIFPYSLDRLDDIEQAMNEKHIIDPSSQSTNDERLMVWASSLELIRENPVIGVGTGDVKDELLRKYKENGVTTALNRKLNAHNQYLQTTITLGLPGIIVFLSGLALAFILSVRRHNLLLFLFIVVISFNFLVESMLERQAGVVFYSFFNSFLVFLVLRGEDGLIFRQEE